MFVSITYETNTRVGFFRFDKFSGYGKMTGEFDIFVFIIHSRSDNL